MQEIKKYISITKAILTQQIYCKTSIINTGNLVTVYICFKIYIAIVILIVSTFKGRKCKTYLFHF